MNNKPLSLRHVLDKLEALYGPPEPPIPTTPWELILRQNVAYMADDQKREIAFRMLRERVGLEPSRILQAPIKTLHEIGRFGIMPELSANKLRHAAQIASAQFGGDLSKAVKLPLKKARLALSNFPGMGEPGAEMVLLFTRNIPVPALESNGLRALLRLGYGKEKKDYGATYRSVQEAMDAGENFDFLIRNYQLLRRHGQQTCKRNDPLCSQCPLSAKCVYFREHVKDKKPKV